MYPEKYEEKSLHEHILLRPDAYIGSIKEHNQPLWIFDEILLNAANNKRRDPSMDSITVKIDAVKKSISVRNNGNGVPVVKHVEKNVYIPQVVFGHHLTSSHFDDNTTGGRIGYGAKLTNIFSAKFTIETADGKNKFKQVFKENMAISSTPIVTPCQSTNKWTQVTFNLT
ncbi:PREDICTED: DNA topoisomerase 2-like [Camelina sativa]|uniref:DNA topoisomerase (ATP-hydrolyzing) n=1 Tax=Camelina sativa TaxID=90675 RepID=A0ABM0X4R6_CAMSA|nr:PREDICTED: DNA topoisomerase 2-like [Camelina sativa]